LLHISYPYSHFRSQRSRNPNPHHWTTTQPNRLVYPWLSNRVLHDCRSRTAASWFSAGCCEDKDLPSGL